MNDVRMNRRNFLAAMPFCGLTLPQYLAGQNAPVPSVDVSFFVVGDTHYCARVDDASQMDEISLANNRALLRWLNEIPGTKFPDALGGGLVPEPQGVLHLGDIIDNGDKGPSKNDMAATECAAFVKDWGLNGGEGLLRWPVREIHGNHDGPRGETQMVREIIARNQRRKGLLSVSENGLHYSWDWGGVHFVALGIVVGDAKSVTRKRRYAPLGSLPFLQEDLAKHVGSSRKPVVLMHHVDVHRYSVEVTDEKAMQNEWDFGDAQAYYQVIKDYRIAASLCGHTHARRVVRWDGSGSDQVKGGIPFLNTDNGAHFHSQTQAVLHVVIRGEEMIVRELATADAWKNATWAPQVWRFSI
jgi:predicted phosphodiesterase